MKHVVVAGGAGFLGSHLCDYLLGRDFSVTCVDSMITGSMENIRHHENNSNFIFVQSDIATYEHVGDCIDGIFNLASPASPVDYLNHPIETLQTGSAGTNHALDIARDHGAVFLLASTSEVYGDPLVHPQTEEYWGNVNPIGPRAVYDEAKRYAEAITMAYHRYFGVDTRIVRIFNTYGPRMRMRDGRVVPEIIGQCLENLPVTVYGDGSQTRSFCYVTDLVEGIYRLYQSDYNMPVNIGNPSEITILEFAEKLLSITNHRGEIVYKPLPVDDPHRRQPDISKARNLLNWEPEVSLEDGLKKTVEYFRNQHNQAN